MLNHVQAVDISPVGDSLTELMYRLQEANPDELRAGEGNLFKRMFGKVKQSIFEITAKYQKSVPKSTRSPSNWIKKKTVC